MNIVKHAAIYGLLCTSLFSMTMEENNVTPSAKKQTVKIFIVNETPKRCVLFGHDIAEKTFESISISSGKCAKITINTTNLPFQINAAGDEKYLPLITITETMTSEGEVWLPISANFFNQPSFVLYQSLTRNYDEEEESEEDTSDYNFLS